MRTQATKNAARRASRVALRVSLVRDSSAVRARAGLVGRRDKLADLITSAIFQRATESSERFSTDTFASIPPARFRNLLETSGNNATCRLISPRSPAEYSAERVLREFPTAYGCRGGGWVRWNIRVKREKLLPTTPGDSDSPSLRAIPLIRD